MADAITRARAIARLDWSVLILGETGSGKDLFAQLIRAASPRRDRAYLCANVATIASDGNLAELELFGRVPGYPHEGDAEHAGLFEQAHRGTLFLDEIGDLPQRVQPMLLRVLEDRKVTRLGGDRTRAEHLRFCDRPLDVRLIFATHADLAAKVAAGSFREDLYYRIYENVVWVPPLRERTEDVEYLLDHFLATECPKSRSAPLTVSPLALDVLRRHSWPGNVRELRNVVRALYETLDVDAESGDEVATALVTDLDDSIVLGTNDAGARFRPHYEAWKRHDRDYKAANRALGFSDDSASIYRAIEKVIGHSVRAINKLEPSHLRARGRRPSPNHRWRE